MKRAAALVSLLALSACASVEPVAEPSPFVDVASAVPGLVVEMRYHGSENFVGRPIAGYDEPVCLLSKEAAAALARVQAGLKRGGLGLKVFDCYRPTRAVADFAAWARDPADVKRKKDYYPNVDKSRLFELGYIAERSGHSRGSTLDVTLVRLDTKAELDMGSGYDLFDVKSWPSDTTVGVQARVNRTALQTAMTREGFRPLKEEWWHFTLNDEPYPETYFDVPVAEP